MKKIDISHIEKHLFDELKHGWDRNPYPLIQIKKDVIFHLCVSVLGFYLDVQKRSRRMALGFRTKTL